MKNKINKYIRESFFRKAEYKCKDCSYHLTDMLNTWFF